MSDDTQRPAPSNPEPTTRPPLVVALGASAGGLAALEQFFAEMPADAGMSFIVVSHLLPDRVSLVPELLARRTAMPVVAVDGAVPIAPNHVYVMARSGAVEVSRGVLRPVGGVDDRSSRMPMKIGWRSPPSAAWRDTRHDRLFRVARSSHIMVALAVYGAD